ncbi:hypothetical protein [Streptomyces niveiscabiei]|uniref:Uncharacterized protein n=1 Tax=Streptomyces niveiscabiei TaxID=164115 RepID=A0ABW9HHG7_9ACTN
MSRTAPPHDRYDDSYAAPAPLTPAATPSRRRRPRREELQRVLGRAPGRRAVWTVDATVRLLPRTAVDGPLHRARVPVPTRRQVLRHRWESAGEPAEFPAFTQVMRALSREVAGWWEVEALPGYPAFTRR